MATVRLPNGVPLPEAPFDAWALLRVGGPVQRDGPAAFRPNDHLGMEAYIPRALNARDVAAVRAEDLAGYHVQEKINGVFVTWTGRELLTKKGLRIPRNEAMESLLPPFPFVGELCPGGSSSTARGPPGATWATTSCTRPRAW